MKIMKYDYLGHKCITGDDDNEDNNDKGRDDDIDRDDQDHHYAGHWT